MGNDMRDALWREVESELEKSAGSIDPDYIDRRINDLCELETQRSGLRPPEAGEAQINAVIARITARAQRKAKRHRPLIRLAAVACIAVVFAFFILFFSNYTYAKVNKSCFLQGTEITLCCGTSYCPRE
jgi:hypothetical protein